MYTHKQMKNFCETIHASASDTVLKKLRRTILTQGNAVRISDPGKFERILSLDDRLLMDHLLTRSLVVDKFKELFGEMGHIIQCLENFFACFLLVKLYIDVVIVLRGLEIRKVSGATFGLVRTMLGATLHLFILSLQTPMQDSDKNKANGNLGVQNEIVNETLAAPMYEENSNQLYPPGNIVNNPIPISSNLSESLGNDTNVVYPLWNVATNFNDSAQGNARSTSSTFFNNSINGNVPISSNNGNAPDHNGIALLPPFLKISSQKIRKNRIKL